MEQIRTPAEQGVAGVTAVVLAIHGAAYGLITGIVLYILIEKVFKDKNEKKSAKEFKTPQQKAL